MAEALAVLFAVVDGPERRQIVIGELRGELRYYARLDADPYTEILTDETGVVGGIHACAALCEEFLVRRRRLDEIAVPRKILRAGA
jgi:hypothetical protein